MENMPNNEGEKEQEIPTNETPQETLRRDIVQSFGTVENPFDTTGTITMRPNQEGGLTLTQRKMDLTNDQMEVLSKLQGKLTPEELTSVLEQKYPEIALKDTTATLSPEEVKKHFEKLSAEAKQEYITGLDDSIDGAETMIKSYKQILEDGGVTEQEKSEAEKDLKEQEEELNAIKKLKETLSA